MTVFTYNDRAIQGESEEAIEGFAPGAKSPYAVATASPFSWSGKSPTGSMKVGWILRQAGKEVSNFAFSINPQSITRSPTTRTQLFGTRGGFFVDDFGAGPTTIQISQFVGSGEPISHGYQTLREHVLAFYDEIWVPAAGQGYSNSPLEVFFYDNHLYYGTTTPSSYVPERVYFPSQSSFQLMRAVTANNVWQINITMVTLDKPANPLTLPGNKKKTKVYIVKANETLKKISVNIAGKKANHKQVLQVEQFLVRENKRITKTRKVPIFSPLDTLTSNHEVTVVGYHVAKGEKLIIPA